MKLPSTNAGTPRAAAASIGAGPQSETTASGAKAVRRALSRATTASKSARCSRWAESVAGASTDSADA
ncbi:MAG: hypothetical protein CO113_12955 [Elusimicrobia bacterium CG_4_9_14_3_um_filter_62_55]|nr:MAG: hypothetical protein COX66_12920 [Elusimicrobia bacterium CG_4_10_14_0_2_um_filter_63_34]PJB24607.1 MAG: hypothetical protein CO113_12955 [Elusimicrobia bacterium CG_4_9_14_3_um_filter_62_55]